MYIYFSLLVALIGCVVYLISANHKVEEIGRLTLFCGLLAFLFHKLA